MPKGIPNSYSVCSIEGCTESADARGMCPSHYGRWRRHGNPTRPLALRWPDNLLQRMEPQPNGCIHFTGQLNPSGYGWITRPSGSPLAHRAAYEHFVGPIPDGYTIDHECHNRDETCAGGVTCLHRRCVNLEHLVAKPARDNVFASPNTPASINAAKTHCIHGHEFTEENTYQRSNGNRDCHACRRARR